MRYLTKIGLVVLIFCCAHAIAQAPQGINYQGVARGLDGQPLSQKDIAIRISVINESANGDLEYDEIHEVKTNSFGLFTLVIGQGTAGTNSFSFIGWTSGKKWLQIEMDENGGRNFKLMGSQQLMSVPYALYAERSGNGYQAGQGISISNNQITNTGDADNNSSNELISSVTLGGDNKLRITDAGGTKEADLSGLLGASQNLSNVLTQGNSAGNNSITNLAAPVVGSDAATKLYVDNLDVDDGDKNATNEIQDLSLALNTLTITNNGSATDIDLSPYLDNTDSQNLSDVLGINNDAGTVTITNLPTPVSASDAATKAYVDNLDALDGDKSASNEIQDLSNTIAGTDRTINISGGTGTTINVADNDNSITNEIQDLNLTGNTLSLSGDVTTVNLTPFMDNTDAQSLSYDSPSKTLTISGGNNVTLPETQNLDQVLTQSNSAGTKSITNLADPSNAQDAATRNYVDAADAALSTRLSNTFAFKANFILNNSSGTTQNNIDIAIISQDFIDFGVISGNEFTAPEDGIYAFVVEGNFIGGNNGGTISISANAVKHNVAISTPYKLSSNAIFSGTYIYKLTAGQKVKLVADNFKDGEQFDGRFSGFKL